MRFPGSISQLVRILCTVALLATGFAHRVPEARAAEITASAYVLPDGTIPVICPALPATGTGTADHHLIRLCETCLLAGSLLLPQPANTIHSRSVPPGRPLRPDRARFDALPLLNAHSAPRAPPRAA